MKVTRRIKIALLLPVLLLAGCEDLGKYAYQVLAISKAEYETTQKFIAEARVYNLITAEQWSQFSVRGHQFIDAHNAAADAFALWSAGKSDSTEAQLQAALEILPRLIREINSLADSFKKPAQPPLEISHSEETLWR